jgi:hypothetical protein
MLCARPAIPALRARLSRASAELIGRFGVPITPRSQYEHAVVWAGIDQVPAVFFDEAELMKAAEGTRGQAASLPEISFVAR